MNLNRRPDPRARIRDSRRGDRRRQKTIMKGVYFEPAVYDALLEMQDKGQNVSKFINRIVRQYLVI